MVDSNSVFEPARFKPNEAWILFRLNDAPVMTERDGDFNVLCLMDAASCYILGSEFVPVLDSVLPLAVADRLLEIGQDRANCLPDKLFLSAELESGECSSEQHVQGIELVLVDDRELDPIVAEAKQSFQEHIGGGRRQ